MKIFIHAWDGIGGTEKAATLYAIGLAAKGHKVFFPCNATGPRASYLQEGGVHLVGPLNEAKPLREFLEREQIDVIHQHVPGYPCHNIIYSVLADFPEPKPLLVETNVFGSLDEPLSDKYVSQRYFISMANGCQALLRAGSSVSDKTTQKNTVLFYPSSVGEPLDAAQRLSFRSQLGVGKNEVLAIRIGRPGAKWKPWECEAFALVRREVPNLRLLLLEPPEAIKQNIQSGRYGEGIIVLPKTSDFEWLGKLNRSADLMIHASAYGESFGYTICEGMEAGLPLIVLSTPWGDNAQVELVQHGITGHVCCSVRGMAQSLVTMTRDAALRKKMGEAGKRRIQERCKMETEIALLDESLRALVDKTPSPLLEARNREWVEFARGFQDLERHTLEKENGQTGLLIQASVYSAYRRARMRARRTLARWKQK